MVDERVFGPIATTVLFENERVRVWEMRLAPGESSPLHRHEHDYLMILLDGDKIAARFEPDSAGSFAGAGFIEGEVVAGNVIFAAAGGVETAVNVGAKEFREIVVELK